jgi:4-amino-4-deoxy-L-arabinose transferase-like glycosyltransferase
MTVRRTIPLVAAFACVLVMYAWRLDFSPPFLADDEAMFALQAQSIATTGHDLSGRFMPLYFQMGPIGETSWFHPALVYFTVPFLTLLSFSEATVRFPSAVIGVVDTLLIYLIARRVIGQSRMALLAAILLALTPAHFMLSRITADYIYPVPFVLAWLWCVLIFLERQKPILLFVGTSCLGFGVYSYIASVITMPMYLMITLGVIALRTRQPLRYGAIATAGFLWPLFLIPLWLAFHPSVVSQTLARYGQPAAVPVAGAVTGLSVESMLREVRQPAHFGSLVGRISLFWYFFDPAYLFITGGYANPINSTRHTGVFLLPLLVFLPVGLWHIATNVRTVPAWLLLVGFFSAPVAAITVPEPYAIDREMAVVAFGALVATMGVSAMAASSHRWIRRSAAVLLLILPIQFAFFLHEYFTAYRGQAAFWFGFNHRGAVEDIITRDEREKVPAIYLSTVGDPAVEAYWRFGAVKHHRQDLLARTVYYDPSTLDIAAMPPGSIVLARRDDKQIERRQVSGELRKLTEIPEIADEPTFVVLQRPH